MVRRFLYDRLYPYSAIPSEDILEDSYPEITGNLFVFNSAVATFHAPSDISGVTGMRREHIRATSSWRRGPPRYDCVLINTYPDINGARGFEIARVLLFFSFKHNAVVYPCALGQWFSFVGDEPDEDTGFWKVEPGLRNSGEPHLAIIHIDSVYRAVHLIPAYQNAELVETTTTMHTSLDIYNIFYVNKFADHHAFEIL
jgi:hypothetical protein